MSTRIVIIDYVSPLFSKDGDQCTGCPRLTGSECVHFGDLQLKPDTKRTFMRHPKCLRAEERTRHASISALLLKSDFEDDIGSD